MFDFSAKIQICCLKTANNHVFCCTKTAKTEKDADRNNYNILNTFTNAGIYPLSSAYPIWSNHSR